MLNVVDQRFHLPAHARESGRVHKLGHLQLYIIQGSLPDWNLCAGTPQVLIGGNCSVEIRAEIKVKNIDCLEDAGPTHQAKSKAWDQTYNSMSRADA